MEPEGIQEATEDQEGQHDKVKGQNDRKTFGKFIMWNLILVFALEANPDIISC